MTVVLAAVLAVTGCDAGPERSTPAPAVSASVAPLPSGLVAVVADERFNNKTLIVIDPATGRRIWSQLLPEADSDTGLDPVEPMTAAERFKYWYSARWGWGKRFSQDWALLASAEDEVVTVLARQSTGWAPHGTWKVPDVPARYSVLAHFDPGTGRLIANAFRISVDDLPEYWYSVDPRKPGDTLRPESTSPWSSSTVTTATTAAGVTVEWSTAPDGRFAGGGIGAAAGYDDDRPYECGGRTGAPVVWCTADLAVRRPSHGALVAVTVDPATRAATLRTVLDRAPAGGLIGAFAAPDGSRLLLWTGDGWLTVPADGSAGTSPAFTQVEGVTPTTHLFPLTWT